MNARAWIVLMVAAMIATASFRSTGAQTTVAVNDGQTLTIADLQNGTFQGTDFVLGPMTTFEINEGGRFGEPGAGTFFDSTFDFAGTTFNVNDGGIYGNCVNPDCGIHSNLNLNIYDGALVLSTLQTGSGTVANMFGGSLGNTILETGSVINIHGGDVGLSLVRARPGSVLNISGGRIRGIDAPAGSEVTFIGGEFRLNGTAYTEPTVSLTPHDVFSGAFSDGSVFIITPFTNLTDPNIKLDTVPLPEITVTNFVIDGTEESVPRSLRNGQSLTLIDGGQVGSLYAQGASIDIQGGTFGAYSRVVETSVTISGGEIGYGFEALQGSTVDVNGGSLGGDSDAGRGSTWRIYGGNHGSFFTAADGSDVNVFGGSFDFGFTSLPGSTVNIHGGTLSDIFVYGGSMNLFVKSASVNGVPLDLEFGMPLEIAERGFNSSLEVVLSDGSPLAIALAPDQDKPPSPFVHPDADLLVTLVPEPQAFCIAPLYVVMVGLCYREQRNSIAGQARLRNRRADCHHR